MLNGLCVGEWTYQARVSFRGGAEGPPWLWLAPLGYTENSILLNSSLLMTQ